MSIEIINRLAELERALKEHAQRIAELERAQSKEPATLTLKRRA